MHASDDLGGPIIWYTAKMIQAYFLPHRHMLLQP